MKEARYKPAVFRRGLLVVLIPGFLGSLLLLVLNFVWQSSAQLSLEEQSRSETVLNMGICYSALKNYAYEMMKSHFESRSGFEERTQSYRKTFYRRLKSLRSAPLPEQWHQSGEEELFGKFKNHALRMAHDAEKIAPAISGERFTNNIGRFISYRKLMVGGLRIADVLESIINEEQKALTKMRADQSALREKSRIALTLGLPIGAAAAFAVMFFFARGIVIRLKLLAQNAGNLPVLNAAEKDEDLLDEFAYLDSTFRQSAQELRDAAQQRQSLTQMLAHDMRSPIMATQVNVEILQKVNAASLSAGDVALCTSVKHNLSNVHDFVSDLLVAEKLECEPIELAYSQFSLKAALDEVLRALVAEAESKQVSIAVDCADGTVTADREQMVLVLKNYLINALRLAPFNSAIAVVGSITAGIARFSFADQGKALSAEAIDYLFDPFRLAPPQGSAGISEQGMNLRIARLIIEAHGGEFGGAPGQQAGREFWFSLPADSAGTSRRPDATLPASVSAGDLLSSSSFQNCILVFAAALILQAVSLFWIDNRLNDAQLLADQAAVQTDTILNINRLYMSVFRAGTATAFLLASGDTKNHAVAEKNIEESMRQIKVLNSLFSEREGIVEEWARVRSFVLNENSKLKGMLKQKEDGQESEDLAELGRTIANTDQLNAGIESLLDSEMKTLSMLRNEQDILRDRFQKIIAFAIFGYLLMTVFLLWLFSASISRRLGVLVELARKIPQRVPITEMVSGKDEIYQIYWLLCRAALNLSDALEQRKAIMNMLSQDIGLPLAQVEKALSQLEANLAGTLTEKSAANLNSARDNINRLLALVDDLLVLDQLEEGKLPLEKNSCSLKEIIDTSVNSLGGLAQKKQITIKKSCQDISFTADRKRMLQVLVNLLANAIKFSPRQSVLVVDGSLENGRVRLAVRDQGPGISAEDAERIFSRFYQQEEHKTQGFGLGLAICSLIVQSHGGEISVESEIGQGATFIIMLPK